MSLRFSRLPRAAFAAVFVACTLAHGQTGQTQADQAPAKQAQPAQTQADQAQQPSAASAQQSPATPPAPSAQQGLAALQANHPQQALDILTQVLAANPNDAAANLLAASAALDLYKGTQAVQFAERARQLDPANWKVHTTLVAAYAEAGDNAARDRERDTLHKLHDDPSAPDAMQTSGFLLDMFPVKQYRVEAVEYFKPVGKLHIYYRFVIRNAEGKRVWQIDAESNDFDQDSWAKAHPTEAAAGQRQFQLAGGDAEVHTDYRMFSGTPDYDAIRAQVTSVIESQTMPFPGEGGK
jgi:tetratricopeptide (TPR) repeat protein